MKKPLFQSKGELRVGWVVDYFGTPCVVDLVNDCRARLVPLLRVQIEIKGPITGEKRAEFTRPANNMNIWPETPLPVLATSRKAFEVGA